MTTTVPDALRPTGPAGPDPEAVAALVQALTRQVRTLHVLKAQVARAQTEAERAMHTVLFVLHDIGPQRVSALAEHLATDPSTTSRQTAELVKRELLERLPDPDDEVHALARSLERFTDGLDRTRSVVAGAAHPTSPTTGTTQNAQENA